MGFAYGSRHHPVGAEGRAKRAAELAPLFKWIREHGAVESRVVRLAFMRHDQDAITRYYANQIKWGHAPAPYWLVDECCAVLGVTREQVFEASGAADGGDSEEHVA